MALIGRRTFVVSALAIALMAWFLRGANLVSVWELIENARRDLLAASLIALVGTFVARAIRWQYLLAPIGATRFRTAFRTTVIGFGALGVLPARLGDVVRPYLLARQDGLPFAAVAATVVIERALDLLAALLLLAVYVWGLSSANSLPRGLLQPIEISAALAAGVAVALLAIMWLAAGHPERIGVMASATVRVLPKGLAERIGRVASVFSAGCVAIRDVRTLLWAVLWSVLVWLAIAAQAWFVALAFGIRMPYVGTFLLEGVLLVGVAVPTPGAVGGFHEAYRIGVTSFFGASTDRAVAAAIVTHALTFAPAILGGLVFIAQDGLNIGKLRDRAHLGATGRIDRSPAGL